MYMKAVFQDKKLLIVLVVDLIITIGSPFLVFGILKLCGDESFAYALLFAIFGVINGILAYLSGDIIIIRYKMKNDIVTSPVPDDVIIRSRQIRYPFVIALIVDILIFAIFAIIYSTTGHWPFM